MKNIIKLFFLSVLLAACTTTSTDKEKQLLEKEKELLRRENELLKKENAAIRQSSNINKGGSKLKNNVEKVNVNWIGTWAFSDNSVDYTLKINDKYRGMNVCTYNATGIQTFYELECLGLDKGDSFELYYRSVTDGVFREAESLNINKPILTLKYKNGKFLTYWNQLINNYVDQGVLTP